MADHDDLKNPEPHRAPEKTTVNTVIELALRAGGGAVTLLSGLLAAVLILYSSYVLYDTFATERAASSSAWDLLQFKPEIFDDYEAPLASSALKDINKDYRAWLTVYDTSIDYPVVQGPNDLYYASHDIYNESSLTGAIYLAAANSGDFSDSYNLLYGHHMDNGAMFGGLDDFTGTETGVLVTENEIYDIDFFAVVSTDAYENQIYSVGNRLNDVLSFLRSGGEGGVGVGTQVDYFNEEIASQSEKIIALSTCADVETSGRLVVFGRLRRRVVTVDLTIQKVWDDANNQDGLRPAKLTVTLSNGDTALLTKENGFTATLSVPKFDNRGEIKYTWAEEAVPGYTLINTETVENKTTLTNRHIPETKSVTVTKVWMDDNDRDGIRPQYARLTLSNGQTLELNEENHWTAAVDDLPVYAAGQKIHYTWTEEPVEGYEASIQVSKDDTTITNTHLPETIEKIVVKEWLDGNNQDGIRPDSLTVSLFGNEEPLGAVTLNDENAWSGAIGNLFANEKGKPIRYRWEEESVEGYTLTDQVVNGDTTTLLNTHIPAVTSLTVSKVWDDSDNRDGLRPGSLRVALNGGREVTLNDRNGWTETVNNLPVYEQGEKIQYTWTEDAVPGYTLTSSITNGTFTTLTNRHETDTIVSTVTKVWEDDENRDGIRPDSVTVTLSNGTEATLNEENGWTYTASSLPAYENGQPIQYTWTEEKVDGYTASAQTEGSATKLTNTHEIEKRTLTIQKIWQDQNDQDGLRPLKITVTLNANGKAVKTVALSSENGWRAAVENLPVNDAGSPILYTWTEQDIEGYTAKSETAGDVTTLTNTHVPAVRNLTVRKVWDDGDNQDGLRPAAVTAVLSNGETVVLNQMNNWTATLENLPRFERGKEIDYFWTEKEEIQGYTLTDAQVYGDTTTLTNAHKPETIALTVEKIWEDGDDRDMLRPTTLQATLFANGREERRAPLNEANGWRATVNDLPVYEAGKKIVYTWAEEELEGYTLTQSVNGDVTTLTNTHQVEERALTVTKVWDDDDNRDALRPRQLTMTLSGNDGTRRTVTLSQSNNWTETIRVPANDHGSAIEYTWMEENVPNYQGSQETQGDTATFTNVHTPARTSRTIEKVWNDGNDQDGLRPESLTVYLLADGEPIETILLNEANGWAYTADHLYVYNGGEAIRYTWREDAVPKYARGNTVTNGTVTTLTNTHETKTATLTVNKVWDDAENQDGLRPASITVTLRANGKKAGSVSLNEGNGWMGSMENLPVNENGAPIAYEWVENPIEGYEESAVVNGFATVLINTHKTERTVATVTKIWDDDDNRDGLRPASVTATLSNGESVVLSQSNNWTATIENLPRFARGKEIDYTWTEQAVEGYTQTGSSRTGTVTALTNTHEPERISVSVSKVWDDDNDRDGLRPNHLFATLTTGQTVELNESNGWSATVENLPVYANGGRMIIYTWSEGVLPGYTQAPPVINENATTLTNIHTPETTSLTVTKVWDDDNDRDGLRPESVTVTLHAGGKAVKTAVLSASNNWTASADDLPVYQNGQAIQYAWTEQAVPGYTPAIAVNGPATVITNTHTPENVTMTVKKIWQDENDHDGLRPESLTVTLTANGKAVKTKVLNAANGWSASIHNLPDRDDDGPITYAWIENAVPEYTLSRVDTTVSADGAKCTTTLTNTHQIATVDLTVRKAWVDDEPSFRPAVIYMVLSGNGQMRVVPVKAADGWTAGVTGLERYFEGREIAYTWMEPDIPGYVLTSQETAGNTTVITNTRDNRENKAPHELIIHYIYPDGEPAAPTYTGVYGPGVEYDVPSPVIPGYRPTLIRVSGIMPERSVEYTVIYLKDDNRIIDDIETPLGLGRVYINVGDCLE